jgi:hypothetical protein
MWTAACAMIRCIELRACSDDINLRNPRSVNQHDLPTRFGEEADYLHFVDMAIASASEVRYLLGLTNRLGILQKADKEPLVRKYDDLIRSLQKLLSAFPSPKPGVRSLKPET